MTHIPILPEVVGLVPLDGAAERFAGELNPDGRVLTAHGGARPVLLTRVPRLVNHPVGEVS